MGCDIHSHAERRVNGKWEKVYNAFTLDDFAKEYYGREKGDSPFDWRSYAMFGFLAGVRNYSCCEPIVEPRGFPDDACAEVKEDYDAWSCDAHTPSFLTAKELLEFDYDKTLWNRRISKQIGDRAWTGAGLAEEGEGTIETYREFLGDSFFQDLEELSKLGDPKDVRVVFWFDN